MKNKAAVALGKLSHSRQSEAQSQASRQNGKLGGRPRKICVHDTARSVTQVNRAIRHLGIEVVRGRGYFYFWSLDPAVAHNDYGWVMVPYLNCMSLHRWIRAAEAAVEEHAADNYDYAADDLAFDASR